MGRDGSSTVEYKADCRSVWVQVGVEVLRPSSADGLRTTGCGGRVNCKRHCRPQGVHIRHICSQLALTLFGRDVPMIWSHPLVAM
jgi:hypothetical protein